MSRELRAYIDELKTEHAQLNKQKSLTKEEKVTKLRLKDKIFELEQPVSYTHLTLPTTCYV